MHSFLEDLLPKQGLYCTARAVPGKSYFIQRFFETLAQAVTHIESMDAQGHTMYMAQSTFDAEKVRAAQEYNAQLPKDAPAKDRHKLRSQENASFASSFWFDIDCGEEKFAKEPHKSYRTQKDAAADLKRFVAETGLPFPSVVSSGNGLYAHWLLDTDIPEPTWKGLAQLLKSVSVAYGFKADPMRTADSASVLRPPGTHNRKKGEEKPVLLVKPSKPIPLNLWVHHLQSAAKEKKVDVATIKPAKRNDDLNSAFLRGLDGPPADPHKIAEKCAQIRQLRDTRGNVDEPVWYAAIGLLRHCEGGRDVIQEWSAGHPDYTVEATDAKIAQHILPPTTCVYFGSINPHACIGCGFKGKFTSPIQLGRPEAEKLAPPEESGVPDDFPSGFSRRVNGIYYDDEPPVRLFPYDFFPVRLAFDEWVGQETVTFRHKTPHNGWKEFTIRSALSHDPKAFLMALQDNHVHIVGGRERKLFVAFAEDYMAKLTDSRRLSQLHSQMGWRDSDKGVCFVLGEKIMHQDGTVEVTGLSRNVPEAVKAFREQGDPDAWSAATEHLDRPGYEGLAFGLLAGAFGAPLMRFTGYAGAMVSMVGDSGVGKTLIGKWALSAYGEHKALMMLRDDTTNSLISRLAVYGTLPLYLDEVTNIQGLDISDLVYRITQGRDKSRLNKNATERVNPNQWNTIALSSSNESLVAKLGNTKANASAEINRVFEYTIPKSCFYGQRETTDAIYDMLNSNYGGIGVRYIKHLAQNYEKHAENLKRIMADLDRRTNASTEERFWSAVLAASIYGGLIAQKLGLIKFSVERVRDWGVAEIQSMRYTKGDAVVSNVALLGMILDRHAGNCLAGSWNQNDKKMFFPVREPHGAIYYRFEIDTKRLFVSRRWLNQKLHEEYGSLAALKADLKAMRPRSALISEAANKTLGAGTHFSTVATPCWELDLSIPEMGHLGLQLVRGVAGEAQAAGVEG